MTPSSTRSTTIVLAGSILLTMFLAWPVLQHPTERIFGVEMVGRHHDPFTVMQQFAGFPVGSGYLQPATDWVGRALATTMSPVAAYNVVVLATFPLAALFACWFAYAVTESTAASVFAGLAFAFSPFHLAQAIYHPHVAQVQWVPLYLLLLWRCAHAFTWPRVCGLIAAGVVAVLANDYHALVLIAITPVALPVFWMTPRPGRIRPTLRHLVLTFSVLAATGAIALVALMRLAPVVFSDVSAASRDDLFIYSARWWSYLIPPVDHPVFSRWIAPLWHAYGASDGLLEQQVYVGVAVLWLCGVALWQRWRHRETNAFVVMFVVLAGVAVICSLSPERTAIGVAWPRPSAFLYTLMPMFRSYARFAVVVQCLLSVVAGVALCLVLAFEYGAFAARSRDVMPTPAYRWIAQHTSARAVFECGPPALADANVSWLLDRPVGYLDAVVPDCGEPMLGAKLRALGFDHLIVRAGRPERALFAAAPDPDFSPIYQGADADVLAVTGADMPVYFSDFSGVDAREYADGRSWRWAGAIATLPIINTSATTEHVSLRLELAAFARARHVRVTLDGQPLSPLLVLPSSTSCALGTLVLAPGRHELVLSSEEPAESPASAGISTDGRRLALRIGRWWWIRPDSR